MKQKATGRDKAQRVGGCGIVAECFGLLRPMEGRGSLNE